MRTERLIPILAAFALASCSDSTSPEEDLAIAEAEVVALFLADADGSGGFLLTPDFPVAPGEFERTRPCPDGGTHAVTGTRSRTVDPSTRIAASAWTTTQTQEDCTVTRRHRGQDVTVVMNGSVTAAGSATHQLPETPGAGRVLLTYQNTRTGSTTTTIGDRTRSCEIAVTESYDAGTDTFTVSGTVCGRAVSVTRDRPARPFGG